MIWIVALVAVAIVARLAMHAVQEQRYANAWRDEALADIDEAARAKHRKAKRLPAPRAAEPSRPIPLPPISTNGAATSSSSSSPSEARVNAR